MNGIRHTAYRLKGLGFFCAAAGAILFFFGVISPRIVAVSPALQHYGNVQELLEIRSSALYYTDLKTQQETQNAVRYALERYTASQ